MKRLSIYLFGLVLVGGLQSAWAQLSADGALSTDETTGAESSLDDTYSVPGTDVIEFSDTNDFKTLYINYDATGVLISTAGTINGNGLILYLDNGYSSGTITDFSRDSGRTYPPTAPWPRNLVVNATEVPDFFLAGWFPNDNSSSPLDLHQIEGTTVTNIASSTIASSTNSTGTGFVAEVYIPYAALFPGVGGANQVPVNAQLRVAPFIFGGDNYSAGDAAPGTDANPGVSNIPSGTNANGDAFDGGTGIADAAQLNVYQVVTLDSNGDGVPDGFTGDILAFIPTGIAMVWDNDLCEITFSEEIDQTTAETVSNYTVLAPGDITILQAQKGTGANINKVYLTLSRKLVPSEDLQIRSAGIGKASNPSEVTPQADQTTRGYFRLLVTVNQQATEDATLFADDKVWIKGEWNNYGFYHGLNDSGPADTMPDVPGGQSVDAVAGDGIRTGYIFSGEPSTPPAKYAYSIVGQIDVPGLGVQEYESGYFQGPFDPYVDRTATTLDVTDPYANRLLQKAATVLFTVHFPKSFALRTDLEGKLRLQGGGAAANNHGIVPPMVNGVATDGIVMTYVSEDASYTTWDASVSFTPGAAILDVAEFRFVAENLGGLGDWYEPDAVQYPTIDPNFKDTTIHIHTFRILNTDGSPNDQDITLNLVDGNTHSTATIDVPAPFVSMTAVRANWYLYE